MTRGRTGLRGSARGEEGDRDGTSNERHSPGSRLLQVLESAYPPLRGSPPRATPVQQPTAVGAQRTRGRNRQARY